MHKEHRLSECRNECGSHEFCHRRDWYYKEHITFCVSPYCSSPASKNQLSWEVLNRFLFTVDLFVVLLENDCKALFFGDCGETFPSCDTLLCFGMLLIVIISDWRGIKMPTKVDESDVHSVTVQIFVDKTRSLWKEAMHYQTVLWVVCFLVLTMKHSTGITTKKLWFLCNHRQKR